MENESVSFIDELIADADLWDKRTVMDFLLRELTTLEEKADRNYVVAHQEIAIINDWLIRKNAQIEERKSMIASRLEFVFRQDDVKTLDLAHGILKIRKLPDKVEITDLPVFLKSAPGECLSVIPEEVKPNLQKIKAFLKSHNTIPGVEIQKGAEKFTYQTRGYNERAQTETGDQGSEQSDEFGIAS